MREKDITGVKLAEKLGIPATTLKSWINRNSFPKGAIEKILTELGVAISGGELGLSSKFEFKRARIYGRREQEDAGSGQGERQLSDLDYSSEDYFELQRCLNGIRGGTESYVIGIVGNTMTGKSRLVSGILDTIRISYDPNSSDTVLEQFSASLSLSLNRAIQARTIGALADQILVNLGSSRRMVIDTSEGGLEGEPRNAVFELIDFVRSRTKGVVIIFTDSPITRDSSNIIENKIYDDALIRKIKPFTYADLVGIIQHSLPGVSKPLTRELIDTIQSFGSHRSLTLVFLEAFKESTQDTGGIKSAQEKARYVLKELLSQTYIECLIVAQLASSETELVEGEKIVEFPDYRGEWIQTQQLLGTTLFQLRGKILTTTPMIHEVILEVVSELVKH